jgi:hypothetical protein
MLGQSIFHFPFSIFHLSLLARPALEPAEMKNGKSKMENGKWVYDTSTLLNANLEAKT